jgi:hypothetical protein
MMNLYFNKLLIMNKFKLFLKFFFFFFFFKFYILKKKQREQSNFFIFKENNNFIRIFFRVIFIFFSLDHFGNYFNCCNFHSWILENNL